MTLDNDGYAMTHFRRALAMTLATALLAAAHAHAQRPLGSPVPQQPVGQAAVDDDPGPAVSFRAHQLSFERVARARDAADLRLRDRFDEAGLPYPAREIYLRVFKHDRILELWARSRDDAEFVLVGEYPVCAVSGQLGPKRRMGDSQIPEGFYHIDRFNPWSTHHLSLGVDYPNLADRIRRDAVVLGGDIYIHGGCETIGCVPIEDDRIEEVYWVAVQAMNAGQNVIPVHIFPTRLDPDRLDWLADTFSPSPELLDFWKNLAEGYAYFESTRRVPWITVAPDGRYHVPAPAATAADASRADEPAPPVAPAGPVPSDS